MGWFNRNKREIKFTELDEETQEEMLAFTGKREKVYKKKWEKLSTKKSPISWNWASFFLSLFWFTYRKMNVYAYVFLSIIVVVDVLSIVFFKKALPGSTMGPAYIVLALFANKLYFDFALSKVKKLKDLYPDRDERLEVIKKRGGVSWGHALLFVLVMVIYGFGSATFEEEVYYSYMTPKFSEAAELQDAGNIDEALAVYNDIENENVPVPSIHFNKSLIYEEQQKYDKALNQMNTYLELAPDDEEAIEIKEEIMEKMK
ncbi:DUF2628 domain-containing protein [Pseudalkalibacillus hwajinpoensis]|uniref:DUF2628 domain-containing protein n=1 Tax=Guptibacillus hwajinpoensis TaxID=208199 RepID=A0A4V5PZ06_9BACL|nr:DUF2628 domain-containing protein [Pseudalkalibacillus hwajinpoensis]TKD72158.1 DUF2628 domain-containing protein [Pseudalkalibacillus hwajinpoensis]